jgi:hypothetical protein
MPRRGDKPREPRPGVYRPGRQPVKTWRVFTGLINKRPVTVTLSDKQKSANVLIGMAIVPKVKPSTCARVDGILSAGISPLGDMDENGFEEKRTAAIFLT